MINIESVIQRCKDALPEAKTVTHAWFMDPPESLQDETPALYIYPGSEKGSESHLDVMISQQVDALVVVYMVVEHSQLSVFREKARQALIGFRDQNDMNGLQFVEGSRQQADAKYIWWKDVYTDQFHVRESI